MSDTTWKAIAREMQPDGSLRDIYVSADAGTWSRFLRGVQERYKHLLAVDHEPDPRAISTFAEAAEIQRKQTVTLRIDLGHGVTAHTHFFVEEELELEEELTSESVTSSSESTTPSSAFRSHVVLLVVGLW